MTGNRLAAVAFTLGWIAYIAGGAGLVFDWSAGPLAVAGTVLCTGSVMSMSVNRTRRPARHATPATATRPDADVAQYLSDDDRQWLKDWGDWTPPSPQLEPSHGNAARDLARIDRQLSELARVAVQPSTGGFAHGGVYSGRDGARHGVDADLSDVVIVDATTGQPVRRYTRDGVPVKRGLDDAQRRIDAAQAAVAATVRDQSSYTGQVQYGVGRPLPASGGTFVQPPRRKRRRPRL